MAKTGSWKAEFDRKYNRLRNKGSMSVIDRINTVLLDAIAGLDQIDCEIKEQGHPYNLPHHDHPDPLLQETMYPEPLHTYEQ